MLELLTVISHWYSTKKPDIICLSQITLCLYWLTLVFPSVFCSLLVCGLGLYTQHIVSFTLLLLFITVVVYYCIILVHGWGQMKAVYCKGVVGSIAVSNKFDQGISPDDRSDILFKDIPKSERNSLLAQTLRRGVYSPLWI